MTEIKQRFIVRTHSSGDNDCTFAVIDVHVPTVLARRELFQMARSKDAEVIAMDYYDCSVTFYTTLKPLEALLDGDVEATQADVSDGVVVRLSTEGELPERSERTECNRLIIADWCFRWEGVAKHTGVTIETIPIKWDWITDDSDKTTGESR